MLSITDIRIKNFITHYVGNNANGDELQLSDKLVMFDSEDVKHQLLQYLLKPFQEDRVFNFWHPSDLILNEVCKFTSDIFQNPEDDQKFIFTSCMIARHLYDSTNLPNIQAGELHVVHWTKGVLFLT